MENRPQVSVAWYRDLQRLEALQVGTRVWVDEGSETLYWIGQATDTITLRLAAYGWDGSGVWMQAGVRAYIRDVHDTISDPVAAAHCVLTLPDAVAIDTWDLDAFSFITDANRLRQRGLLGSRSVPFIDLVVESRTVTGGRYWRVKHLAPTRKSGGGYPLWP